MLALVFMSLSLYVFFFFLGVLGSTARCNYDNIFFTILRSSAFYAVGKCVCYVEDT